ncbi:DUF2971 domain-containing protein [Mycobacterium sp. 94-17]|uniref:DUF2971 domain-containing protein n=1 Tax=Mycobacterium sp. 94-17 TaxID=2986147 RepID=UPI002D1F94FA|nr:DUF2971 domain-containing protein [Mycobacterium sp. 94-17]MEB4212321.1 DUF2971 domain-containing protein [Mycobacterium sp. 94-17]
MTVPNHPQLEDCLFHYTTTAGLQGILENRCIRATDSAFLNDSSEITYAAGRVEVFLENRVKEHEIQNHPAGSPERRRMGLMDEAKSALHRFNKADYNLEGNARTVFEGATYVACFTEKPDQLSQWRGYGGRGYSIGFTREGLNQLITEGDEMPVGNIIQVGYGEPALQQLEKEVHDYFAGLPTSSIGTSGLTGSFKFIFPKLATVKHGAFVEEKEWRAIVSRYVKWYANFLHFREGTRLVPYLNLKFNPEAVAWVYIGPGGTIHDKRALRAFLAVNGYDLDRVWIELSDAPYRGD